MRSAYTPRAFAPLAAKLFAEQPRSCLFAKPGMGKTSLVLTFLADLYGIVGERRPTLILGPKRVAQHVWTDEAAKWKHTAGLELSTIVGDERSRLAALRRDVPVYVTNYEQLPWLARVLGKRWPFGTVVADESSKLKSFRLRQGSIRARALARYAHKPVRRWINLTGTPAANGLQDLWGQLWFIDEGARLGRTFSAFDERFFTWRNAADAHNRGKAGLQKRPVEHAQDLIQELIADVCLTLDPADWFDLAAPIVNRIEVDLPASAAAAYRQMERELFAKLDTGEEVEAFNAAALTMKCLQLANGAVYTDPEGKAWAGVHDAKIEALADLVEENDGPVLCAYHFVSDRARLLKRFPDALDLATAAGMAAAKRGEGKLWLGHPASMGHGVDGLQHHCCTVAVFGHWWDLEQYEQLVERVGPMRQLQAGTGKAVFVHHIVARKTIDEVVTARRTSKASVQKTLLDYLKAKP